MAILPVRTVVRGNPPSSLHQVDPKLLSDLLEYIENLAASGKFSAVVDLFSQLPSDPANGDTAMVLSGSGEGIWTHNGTIWVRVADLPRSFGLTEVDNTSDENKPLSKVARDIVSALQQVDSAQSGRIALLEAGQSSDRIAKPTWAALSATAGAFSGQVAEVSSLDTGTHTDPVVGGTVANGGKYSWAGTGWQWIEESGALDAAAAVAVTRRIFSSSDDVVASSITFSAGDVVNISGVGTMIAADAAATDHDFTLGTKKFYAEVRIPEINLGALGVDTTGSTADQSPALQNAINILARKNLVAKFGGSIRADHLHFTYHPTYNPSGLQDESIQGTWGLRGGVAMSQTQLYQGKAVGARIYSQAATGNAFVAEKSGDLDAQKFASRNLNLSNIVFAAATTDGHVMKVNHVSNPVLQSVGVTADHKNGYGLQMRGSDQWDLRNIAIIGDPSNYATGTGKALELDQNLGGYTSTSGEGPADSSRSFWDGCMIRAFADAGHIGGTTIGEKQIAMSRFSSFGTNNVLRSLTFGGIMWSNIFDAFQLRGDVRGAQLRGKLVGNVWDALNCAVFEQTIDDESAALLIGHISDAAADRAFFNNVIRNFYCAEQGSGMAAVKWKGAAGYEGIFFERPTVFMRTAADIFAHFLSTPAGGGWSDLALHGAATYSMANVYSGSIPFGDGRLTAFSDHLGNGYRGKNNLFGSGTTVAAANTTNLNFGPYHNITGTGSIHTLRFISGTQKIMHGTTVVLRFASTATLKGLGGTGTGNLDIGADRVATAGQIMRLVYDTAAASGNGGWYIL